MYLLFNTYKGLFVISRKKKLDSRIYYELALQGLKYCPRCEQGKPVAEFRAGFCIECSKAVCRESYARTKENYAKRYREKRESSGYYVYKFLNNEGNIIYIGKSIRIKARMTQHFITDGHLPEECYGNVTSVFYCPLPTKVDMDIYEMYLIDKVRPKYNTMLVSNYDTISNIVLPELHWLEYEELA